MAMKFPPINRLTSFLFRLTRWSGLPNDDDVQLDAFNGTRLEGGDSDAGARFDGTDTWVIDSASSLAGVSLFRSTVGYVRNGVLVARFSRLAPKLRFYANGGTLLTNPEMYAVTVVANISMTGQGGFSITSGRLGATTAPEQILIQLQRAGTCARDAVFATAVDYVCENRDLPANLASPPSAKCEQISIGMSFEAKPAKISSTIEPTMDAVYCDAGIDPTQGCGSR